MERSQARAPGGGAAGALAKNTDRRGKLAQAALLPSDREHLDTVDARGLAPPEEALPLAGALGSRFGLVEVALGQGDRRPDVLAREAQERLPRAACDPEEVGDVASRRLELTQGDQHDHPPAHRRLLDLDVAQLVAQVPRRGEHLQDLVQRAGTASRVRPREKDRETTPVAEPTRHLDGVRVDDRGPLVITAVGEHPGKGREQTDPEGRILPRRGRRSPPRAAPAPPGAPCPPPSRRPPIRSPPAQAFPRRRRRGRPPRPR